MKTIAKFLFEDKLINYAIGIVLGLLIFLLFWFVAYQPISHKLESTTIDIILFFGFLYLSASIVLGSKETAPPRKEQHLIDPFGGETDVWFKGTILTFYLFKPDSHEETIDLEQQDLEIPPIECSDKKKLKLIIQKSNFDWSVHDSPKGREKFKHAKSGKMMENISSMVTQAIIRIIGGLDFETQIKGKNFGQMIQDDDTLKLQLMNRYGIIIEAGACSPVPANMDIETKNLYAKNLRAELKRANPKMSQAEIERIVNVRLFGAKENNVNYNKGATPFVKIDA